ncbi:DEAD/DEAH box helicase domain protein [Desulfobulbus propionicus DSM 2032]|uniref:DEAD/DEAH box helicase domain protein n=2 Tax=Desulfobulbus propionicus TaxID=894 RepID=A0A7U3YMY5_DESPD|nr:DEAD/DEAH box helicase domain protein [Desulfobulbus propionicus DSM 2032]
MKVKAVTMQPIRGTVAEYLAALKSSSTFGPQVVAHRVTAPREAVTLPPDMLMPALRQLLELRRMAGLYAHQHQAIGHILAGGNTVVATPTASGKSLIYTLPVFQTLLHYPAAKALYLFPLKALAQDQLKTVEQLWHLLPATLRGELPVGAIYDGDTSGYRRKKIRDVPPPIMITNPDMLHLSLLPYHDRWAHFWANLRYVVIDEIHTYRGVFGSHVAWVIRRLKRICALYGSSPLFILASATIGNPGEHGRLLIDAPVTEITQSGAGSAARHTLLLNPLESAATSATRLLEAAISRELRTIVYCQSRKMTELITVWTEKRLKERKGLIASYRSGFLPEERRGIEDRLASGSLLGVISTSALELGIDIGHLDLCILVGYPGSMMATWQRAGRVGRKQQESLVVLIGHEDALDQHFMRHPEDFFSRPVEPVTMHVGNPHIAGPQLVCAAAEIPFSATDPLLATPEMRAMIERLTRQATLLQSADGNTWFSPQRYPQRHVNLRGGGTTLSILVNQPRRQLLGIIDAHRALRECHPGAIYLHMARTYHVDSLDLEGGEILVTEAKPAYFTRVLTEKSTEIMAIIETTRCGAAQVRYGTLRVTERITGYHRIAHGSLRIINRVPLDLPPQRFETEGFWVEIPDWLQRRTEEAKLHFMGGIHALEHAMIGLMPLMVLCDRNDLGGISHPWHDQVAGPAVFVYDGHAGGMGLTARAFGAMQRLLQQTRQLVADCPCDLGCPSCVHSPKCGSGNRPIDKQACGFLLEQLMHPAMPAVREVAKHPRPLPQAVKERQRPADLPRNFGVFDIETQRSAEEVGGWHRAELMRVSVAVLYESCGQRFTTYTEATVGALIERLFALDLVVGFNNKRFDNKVLSAYTNRDLGLLPSFDLLEAISGLLGYRLSLDRLAEKTLRVKKEGNGLEALRWFKRGEMEKLAAYCRKDVEITRDLFLYGCRQQYLLFQNKAGQEVRLPVDFIQSIEQILDQRERMLRARQDLSAPSQ